MTRRKLHGPSAPTSLRRGSPLISEGSIGSRPCATSMYCASAGKPDLSKPRRGQKQWRAFAASEDFRTQAASAGQNAEAATFEGAFSNVTASYAGKGVVRDTG